MRNFDNCMRLFEDSRRTLAGGAHSSMRGQTDPVLFFERAEGPYIFDADGNRYIDYKMGAGPLILGHSPQDVIAAVKSELDRGLQTATETAVGAEVAARFVELVPCADLVRFANTGSEAIHLALRLARAWRGRKKIVRFEGHYHGWFDNIWTNNPSDGAVAPATEGQGDALRDVIELPWNNADALSRAVAEHADQIGGVIMNPMMLAGAPGGTMPRLGYLEGVRRICSEHEIVLVFDEVLTGFRVALGGAQELFGVEPDLAVYAKAIAAGLPLAAVAGRREVMELIASGRVLHPGTYNGNSLSMAAARAALEHLSTDQGRFYRYCNGLREQLSDRFRRSASNHNIGVHVTGAGAVMTFWFTDRPDYYDYRTATAAHDSERSARFVEGMFSLGILCMTTMYLTDAHTQREVGLTSDAIEQVMKEL